MEGPTNTGRQKAYMGKQEDDNERRTHASCTKGMQQHIFVLRSHMGENAPFLLVRQLAPSFHSIPVSPNRRIMSHSSSSTQRALK